MTILIKPASLLALLCLLTGASVQASQTADAPDHARAQEQWAYALGIQAYVFSLPLTIFEREYRLRTDPERIERIRHQCPCALLNQVGHKFGLASAADIMPYTPNNDTVYSGILLDFSDQPMIVSLPEIHDRYWSAQVTNPYLENQFYLGTRASEGRGGHHAFLPPGWQGKLPRGVTAHPMQYTSALLALRIGVKPGDRADLQQVSALQRQVQVTSLSNFRRRDLHGQASMPRALPAAPDHSGELAYFARVAELMRRYPPVARHDAMVTSFRHIGLQPGQPFTAHLLPDPVRRGLVRALEDAPQIMQWKVKYRGTPYPSRWNNLRAGDYGVDYFDRAAGALEGLIVHSREEAVYFSTYESGNGDFLDGSQQYVLHFEPDQLPRFQDNGFWSLTLYGPDFQLVDNPIDRYAIGNRSDELVYNADGSLDIYIQSTQPPENKGNWLPSPPEGLFRINYRIYLPTEEARDPDTLMRFLPPIQPSPADGRSH